MILFFILHDIMTVIEELFT